MVKVYFLCVQYIITIGEKLHFWSNLCKTKSKIITWYCILYILNTNVLCIRIKTTKGSNQVEMQKEAEGRCALDPG